MGSKEFNKLEDFALLVFEKVFFITFYAIIGSFANELWLRLIMPSNDSPKAHLISVLI